MMNSWKFDPHAPAGDYPKWVLDEIAFGRIKQAEHKWTIKTQFGFVPLLSGETITMTEQTGDLPILSVS